MAHSVSHNPQASHVRPQGTIDHRTRAPGSGYQGGPTATSSQGPPANIGAGHLEPPKPPPTKHVGRFVNTTA
jgi:hypothetical protein